MNSALYYWDRFLTAVIRTPALLLKALKAFDERIRTPSVLEQSLLLKRLAMLLQSGLPIGTSLRLLVEGHTVNGTQTRLAHVVTLVESGVPLSHALERGRYPVSTFTRNVIRIGETLGTLPETLNYVAIELKAKHELRKQIIQALIYPAVIILATIAISVFLIVVIFPKIIPIFQSVHTTLPWSTRTLMALSYGLSHYGFIVCGGLVVGLLLLMWSQRFMPVRQFIASVTLRLPVVGRLVLSYQVALGCRTLGVLLASEVRIVEALLTVMESIEHPMYRVAWLRIAEHVQTGQRLSTALRMYPKLFPAVVIQMIQAGETTGNLSESLQYLAVMYEEDVRDITKNLTTLLEPILMLVMGLVVGFIAVSIITPIYGITEHLHA